jgi:hypothetical protein
VRQQQLSWLECVNVFAKKGGFLNVLFVDELWDGYSKKICIGGCIFHFLEVCFVTVIVVEWIGKSGLEIFLTE